ncbi:hypothetical protein [Pseudomonas typographi]|uniref:hypothetical protein n=1 Tax=Pseudomonas typographi TaxID=2715964 RepID=UPI001685419A|nr:hypothetical protein [Pseudomonas typographi]MBD1589779.1 hypothetical protein [Pseudomonas typographi]
MTAKQKTTEELFEEMRREAEADRAQGAAYFDGGSAWPEFCKKMGDAALSGALVDDFDDK